MSEKKKKKKSNKKKNKKGRLRYILQVYKITIKKKKCHT